MIPPSLIVLLIAIVASFGAGWQVHDWKTEAAQKTAIEEAAEAYRRTVEGWSAAVTEVTTAREAERRKAAADRLNFRKEMQNEKAPLVECPAVAAGDPPAVPRLGAGGVRLWNKSLAIGLPDALRAGRTDGPGAPAGAAGIDDALANLADNSETCNDLRGKLLAWQAWARKVGAAK